MLVQTRNLAVLEFLQVANLSDEGGPRTLNASLGALLKQSSLLVPDCCRALQAEAHAEAEGWPGLLLYAIK